MRRSLALRAALDATRKVGLNPHSENFWERMDAFRSACQPPMAVGTPWSGAFVVYRFRQAAREIDEALPPGFPLSGRCLDFWRWAQETGNWVSAEAAQYTPDKIRVGDLALFYCPMVGTIAHAGIVLEVQSWGVVTVEGDTCVVMPDGSHIDRGVDEVCQKKRFWHDLGKWGGFARIGA